MPSEEEILAALDRRLLEAITGEATSETILRLAEARAWVLAPSQHHGARSNPA